MSAFVCLKRNSSVLICLMIIICEKSNAISTCVNLMNYLKRKFVVKFLTDNWKLLYYMRYKTVQMNHLLHQMTLMDLINLL